MAAKNPERIIIIMAFDYDFTRPLRPTDDRPTDVERASMSSEWAKKQLAKEGKVEIFD